MIIRNSMSAGQKLAVALLIAVVILAVLHARDASTPQSSLRHSAPAQIDPLTAELAHCQSMGGVAIDDPGCQEVWAENRRRFFDMKPAAPLFATAPSAGALSRGR